MLDPHDDTDVPSGSTDGALMENTSFHVPRLQQSRSALAGACARLNSALALSRAVDPRMIISAFLILARCLRRRVAVLLMVLLPRQRRVSRLVKSGEEACQTA